MFSKHTRLVKHLPVLPVLWPLVRREGQFAPAAAGVQVAKELRHLQQIKYVEGFSSHFFFKLVTIARTGKGLEDDGLSGRGREVA